jgi:hypothetical protein
LPDNGLPCRWHTEKGPAMCSADRETSCDSIRFSDQIVQFPLNIRESNAHHFDDREETRGSAERLWISGNVQSRVRDKFTLRHRTFPVAATAVAQSAVDDGHIPLVVALAGGRRQVVQPFDLLGAQLDAVGGGVLLDTGDALRAGNRGDVVPLCE